MATRSAAVLVTVPHRCLYGPVLSLVRDPGCDRLSMDNALRIARHIALRLAASTERSVRDEASSEKRVRNGAPTVAATKETPAVAHVPIFASITPRFACDNNRLQCRERTPMRRMLSRVMAEQANQRQPFVVIDVHSFRNGSDFNLNHTPEVVLLDTHHTPLVSRATNALRRANVDVVGRSDVVGSVINDIQFEARQRGGDALLVEVREDLDAERVNRIADALASTVVSTSASPIDTPVFLDGVSQQ